jgi:hypothetical protein
MTRATRITSNTPERTLCCICVGEFVPEEAKVSRSKLKMPGITRERVGRNGVRASRRLRHQQHNRSSLLPHFSRESAFHWEPASKSIW